MELPALLRLGHALAGVAFVAGIVGMWFVMGAARRADTPAEMRRLVVVARPFGLITSVGGISLTVLGIATAVALGLPLLGPLQGGGADWLFVSNLLMLPIIGFLAVVYPRFRVRLLAELAGAETDGRVTPGLAAAWADRAHTLARRYELAAVGAVLVLMIARPF